MADVVLYDRLVCKDIIGTIPETGRKNVRWESESMQVFHQEEINSLLAYKAKRAQTWRSP